MKKTIIASLLAITGTAFAADVSVSAVHDYTNGNEGFRVGTSVSGLSLTATQIENKYNRYAVGKDFSITKIGPVELIAGAAVNYQDTVPNTVRNKDGYGLTVGAKAVLPVTKNVDLIASAEHFAGQSRISKSEGNVGSIGLKVKF
jgi:hypothetical protein